MAPFGTNNAAGNAGLNDKGGLANKSKGTGQARNLTAHLVMIEPTQIQVSQTGCTTQDVTFTNAEASAKFASQSASGVPARDSMGLDALSA
jgi:hypothetical protein